MMMKKVHNVILSLRGCVAPRLNGDLASAQGVNAVKHDRRHLSGRETRLSVCM